MQTFICDKRSSLLPPYRAIINVDYECENRRQIMSQEKTIYAKL